MRLNTITNMNNDLSDLFSNTGTVVRKSNTEAKTATADEIKLNYCCDVVLTKNNTKYILGTNQLFPIYDIDVLNGGIHDVQMYLYSALKWNDMLYTDSGDAVRSEEDPDATLGYNCGVRIFNYRGGTPCLPRSKHERTLTVDEWCRLAHNAIPTHKVLPSLWVEAEYGHKFWTPDKGLISALPVNSIPITLETEREFKRTINYRSPSNVLATRVISMLYAYMRENNASRLYIGYECNLVKDPETELINAYDWSTSHCRRVGEIPHNHKNLFGHAKDGANRKLAIAVRSGTFSAERIFA